MPSNNVFNFKFRGENVTPQTVRLRDLYDVLHAFESAVSLTAHQHFGGPTVDLHLVDIGEGSTDCWLFTTPAGYKSAEFCAAAIARGNLSELPSGARDSLLAIQKKARTKRWTFTISDGNGMPEAEIGPETDFITDAIIYGASSLTGWINRVGGTERPTAHFLLPDFSRFVATISSQELASELGKLLYKSVTVDGEAEWATPDWRLTDFKITSIAGVNQATQLTATLQGLAEIAGSTWDDVDPEDFVAGLRSQEM